MCRLWNMMVASAFSLNCPILFWVSSKRLVSAFRHRDLSICSFPTCSVLGILVSCVRAPKNSPHKGKALGGRLHWSSSHLICFPGRSPWPASRGEEGALPQQRRWLWDPRRPWAVILLKKTNRSPGFSHFPAHLLLCPTGSDICYLQIFWG